MILSDDLEVSLRALIECSTIRGNEAVQSDGMRVRDWLDSLASQQVQGDPVQQGGISGDLWSDKNSEDEILESEDIGVLTGAVLNLWEDVRCLKENLAKAMPAPKQEPVIKAVFTSDGKIIQWDWYDPKEGSASIDLVAAKYGKKVTDLYDHPPQAAAIPEGWTIKKIDKGYVVRSNRDGIDVTIVNGRASSGLTFPWELMQNFFDDLLSAAPIPAGSPDHVLVPRHPRKGENYEAGLWSERNWESLLADQAEGEVSHA